MTNCVWSGKMCVMCDPSCTHVQRILKVILKQACASSWYNGTGCQDSGARLTSLSRQVALPWYASQKPEKSVILSIKNNWLAKVFTTCGVRGLIIPYQETISSRGETQIKCHIFIAYVSTEGQHLYIASTLCRILGTYHVRICPRTTFAKLLSLSWSHANSCIIVVFSFKILYKE
jgi:hypothetical protein